VNVFEINALLVVALVVAAVALVLVVKTATVVPQQSAYVVERLGRFSAVLEAGFHVLVPFLDAVRYRHTLKEQALDIPEQICITRDNVQVAVDGILYLKVLDAQRASYGISDYGFAVTQLAQTALRSEIGKIELDRTFEERGHINSQVVSELDKATGPWGVKVLRYEIKNITPPKDIIAAMEKQMRAEREKRALILTSEGERDALVNTAEGHKQEVIKASEAKRQQQINEAQGQAEAILAIASATAQGITRVAEALRAPGGVEAVQLRVAEQYVAQFGNLAKAGNTLVLPANLSDVGSMIALAMNVVRSPAAGGPGGGGGPQPARPPPPPQPRAPAPQSRPPPLDQGR
jgi:regulator of protease activity HflC (stomatin/prohibitin superfamily)